MKLEDKIKNYLGNGGLFNPELMEHEKVRDLIIECQEEIQKLKLRVKNLKFNNDYVEEVEYKNSNLLEEVKKLKQEIAKNVSIIRSHQVGEE